MEDFVRGHPLLARVSERPYVNAFGSFFEPIDNGKTTGPSVRRPVQYVQSVCGSAVRFLSCVFALPLPVETADNHEEMDLIIAIDVIGQRMCDFRVTDVRAGKVLTELEASSLMWSGALGVECSFYHTPLLDQVVFVLWGRFGMDVFVATTRQSIGVSGSKLLFDDRRFRIYNVLSYDQEKDQPWLDVCLNPHKLGQIAVLISNKSYIEMFDCFTEGRTHRYLLHQGVLVTLDLEDSNISRIEGACLSAKVVGETMLNTECFTCLCWGGSTDTLILAGARLWSYSLSRQVLVCLYPQIEQGEVNANLIDTHDEVANVQDLAFTAVCTHPHSTHNIAAVSAITFSLYLFDMRLQGKLMPLMKVPLYPDFRTGIFHHKILWLSKDIIRDTYINESQGDARTESDGQIENDILNDKSENDFVVICPASTFQECLRAPAQVYVLAPQGSEKMVVSWRPCGDRGASSEDDLSDDAEESASEESVSNRKPFDFCLYEFSRWQKVCHLVDGCLRGLGDFGMVQRRSTFLQDNARLVSFMTGPPLGYINSQLDREVRKGRVATYSDDPGHVINSEDWKKRISKWIVDQSNVEAAVSLTETRITGFLDSDHVNLPDLHSWTDTGITHPLAMPRPFCCCGNPDNLTFYYPPNPDPLQADIIGPGGTQIEYTSAVKFSAPESDQDKNQASLFDRLLKCPRIELNDRPTPHRPRTAGITAEIPDDPELAAMIEAAGGIAVEDTPPESFQNSCKRVPGLCASWASQLELAPSELPEMEPKKWDSTLRPYGLTVNESLVKFLERTWTIETLTTSVPVARPRYLNTETATVETQRRAREAEDTLLSIMSSQRRQPITRPTEDFDFY